ncbi:amino acid ABC transporter permease [Heyndrickxia coagulans]|uniref:Glutamine ABC transporter permease n=2 Tax=Heyndrickxia TaxID=2837504 RepID=A0A5J4JDL0_9BACI|nr:MULTISPECIES: amino acid ABC transporter permease [Heyndrickxia]APB38086.1 amino acid ABC transporter permease [Heyndrickxia coagulans]KWZ83441.1 ABC transporter, permease protein [Heyndrickxia coagulans]MDL5039588.1 amino acid ABC transporter permease [Heyndrickxia coagulans]MDT9754847.1 amino acid ABC transporter permease [Heyndrickxia coagulans]MED4312838.1 amino acid ABC transporter permease [Heyndrickxia coagulans]
MDIRFDIIIEYLPYLLKGTLLTIGLSVAGILFGMLLGLLIGLGEMIRNKILALPFLCYVGFFRGTPLFVQILIVNFGAVPLFLGKTNGIVAGVIALSLNSAAYVAEILRGGVQSIEKGQMEAARSLGLSHVQAMRYVILPQAFKRMIPPLGNEFIVLIKDSSLVSVIAAPEIVYWAQAMETQYYRVWEPYLTAAFLYLVLTLSLSFLLRFIERRLATE